MKIRFILVSFTFGCLTFYGHSQNSRDINIENTCGLFSPYQIDIEHFLGSEIDSNGTGLYTEMEITPGNEITNRANPEFYLRIDVYSPKNTSFAERRPLNVCLVLDRSASMSEHGRMDKLKIALKEFVKRMKPDDYIAIVAYDDFAEVLLPSQKLSNIDKIFVKIDAMTPGRATNILAGLMAGYGEIRKNYDNGRVNRLILMSDGMSNVGETSPSEIIRKSKLASEGIETSTFGLGADINFELMTALARQGNGMSHFIGDCDSIYGDVGYALQEETTNMMAVMNEISLTLEYPKQVEFTAAYGYEVEDSETGKTKLKLSNISAGEKQAVLAAFRIKESMRKPVLVRATLKYVDGESGKKTEIVRGVKLYFMRKDANKIDPFANEYVRAAYLSASLADELKKSLYLFSSKRYKDSLRILDKCYSTLLNEKKLPDDRHFKYLYRMLLVQRIFLRDKTK